MRRSDFWSYATGAVAVVGLMAGLFIGCARREEVRPEYRSEADTTVIDTSIIMWPDTVPKDAL